MCDYKFPPSTIIMETRFSLSDHIDDPIIISLTNTLFLNFGTELDKDTVDNSIKVFKIDCDNIKTEVPVNSVPFEGNSSIIVVTTKDDLPFDEGEEFKIETSSSLKSSNGFSLSNNNIYFAINYSFDLNNKSDEDIATKRNLVVCLSDILLGIDDSFSELKNNKKSLELFLKKIRFSSDVKELVFAGNIFDQWSIPGNLDTLDGKSQLYFINKIAENNINIIDLINKIILDNKIKVTYIPGSHDMLFTEGEVDTVLPGIHQSRDVQGLGAYTPNDFPYAIIENGHRFNFFCAPDPISNRSFAPNSILPPGYFLTRIATTCVTEKYPHPVRKASNVNLNTLNSNQYLSYLYWKQWEDLINKFPVKESFDEKFINTNIDGFEGNFSINELLPYQTNYNGSINFYLYDGIQDSWNERQSLNRVPVPIPTDKAISQADLSSYLDNMSYFQFFSNPKSPIRIVIFGHTHQPVIIQYKTERNKKAIYANTGTWVDKSDLNLMTFVVLAPQKSNNSTPTFVNLYRFTQEGESELMDSQCLINLNYSYSNL